MLLLTFGGTKVRDVRAAARIKTKNIAKRYRFESRHAVTEKELNQPPNPPGEYPSK
jgi:hypothetical protein